MHHFVCVIRLERPIHFIDLILISLPNPYFFVCHIVTLYGISFFTITGSLVFN